MTQTHKIIEVVVTDERGETHTLRCEKGIDLDVSETGSLLACTVAGAVPRLTLTLAGGRWIGFRTVQTK